MSTVSDGKWNCKLNNGNSICRHAVTWEWNQRASSWRLITVIWLQSLQNTMICSFVEWQYSSLVNSLPSSLLWGKATLMGVWGAEWTGRVPLLDVRFFSSFFFFFLFTNCLWIDYDWNYVLNSFCHCVSIYHGLFLQMYDWQRSSSFDYTHMLHGLFVLCQWMSGNFRGKPSGKTSTKLNSDSACWLIQLHFAALLSF